MTASARYRGRRRWKKVRVVGLGPAGFTLAQPRMNDGHTVVAVDGPTIEPLPAGASSVVPVPATRPLAREGRRAGVSAG